MFDKLKQRWNIKSNWQIVIILIVFSVTGTAALVVRKLAFGWIGITADTTMWLKVPLYILILIPAYQVLLLIIGALFGQFRFFYEFEKKSFGRFFVKRGKKVVNEIDKFTDEPKNKTAVLLLNLGTPDAPSKRAVFRYLTQFLNDKRVIDNPWIVRKTLVNFIIIPLRIFKTTKLYQQLWTDKGSPLLVNTQQLTAKVREGLSDQADVFFAMRYQNPSIKGILRNIHANKYQHLVVLPLFPQYASSTTATAIKSVWDEMKNWAVIPQTTIIDQFYNHPAFINAFAKRIASHKPENYDLVLFSYHGLPVRHTNATHPEVSTTDCSCDIAMPKHGSHCYRATCYETTRLITTELGLESSRFITSFQSRLSTAWLEPFSDVILTNLPAKGVKKVLVVSPSFVADCLETIVEIGYEYKELFIANGGEEITMVESLNAEAEWVSAVRQIVGKYLA